MQRKTPRQKMRYIRETIRLCISLETKNETVTDAEKDTQTENKTFERDAKTLCFHGKKE